MSDHRRLHTTTNWFDRLGAWIRGVPPRETRKASAPTDVDANIPTPEAGRIGVCCSGGGIRSAAYNLGALQVLQEEGILRRAQYLAAVSGGSYIAAAFSIVQKRPPGSDDGATSTLPLSFDDVPPYAPGSPEERWLRNRSSYMAPGLRGKSRLASRLVLGMLLNLVLLGAIITLVAVPLGLVGSWLQPQLLVRGAAELPVDVVAALRWLVIGLGCAGLLFALVAAGWRLDDDAERRVMRAAKLLAALAGTIFVVAFALPWTLEVLRALLQWTMGATEAGAARDLGELTALLAALGVPPLVFSLLQIVMENGGETVGRFRRWLLSPKFAAAVAAPMLLASGFLFAYNFAAGRGSQSAVLVALVAALVVYMVLYLYLDPTASSLHPTYKRRLGSAFAVYRDTARTARERPYFSERMKLSDSNVAVDGRDWPQLLICAAANISDEGATPPGRNAAPFVFTHDRIGGDLVGTAETSKLEEALADDRERDITLLSAVAMSGAAISPSMGKMSSKAHTFLLALANARLGVWVPNPRYLADKPKESRKIWGRLRLTWLFREMLGWNALDAKYLYITDGGHYENLGLVELLRRGCTEIYCFDASGDQGTCSTIGQSIALARSELGVDIRLNPDALARVGNADGAAHVIAPIFYPKDKTGHRVKGTLVFAKATVPSKAPWDIRAHQQGDPTFPHNSTADQLYTDERFEAYRALGAWSAEQAVRDLDAQRQRSATVPVRQHAVADRFVGAAPLVLTARWPWSRRRRQRALERLDAVNG